MSRQAIREMKRAVVAGNQPDATISTVMSARKSALELLARSVCFGHVRLAIIRLGVAVRTGATVPQSHWIYCREAAAASKDTAVQALFMDATRLAAICQNDCIHPRVYT